MLWRVERTNFIHLLFAREEYIYGVLYNYTSQMHLVCGIFLTSIPQMPQGIDKSVPSNVAKFHTMDASWERNYNR